MPAKKATLLCVDDDSQCLSIRRLVLEAHGFNVVTSVNPKQSLKLFRSKRFDAAIVDYQMPEMNGAELAKEMKSARSDVPILMLSGLSELPAGEPAFHDCFVCKSEASHKLVKEIQALIQPSNGGGGHGAPVRQKLVAFSGLALGFVVEAFTGRTRATRSKQSSVDLKALAARA